jgi:hypothetical protein
MTFSEFVINGFSQLDGHWSPIHEICNPCIFNASHVGKMETFSNDARAILSKMGLNNVIDEFNEKSQVCFFI